MSNGMGITFTKAFQTSDGETFAAISEAQKHELLLILTNGSTTPVEMKTIGIVIETMLDDAPAFINILSTTASSRPKGRKANGATRKPKTKPETERME